MKLIEKQITGVYGDTYNWHAVEDFFVDVAGGYLQIIYASWISKEAAKLKLPTDRTASMDVYFSTWNPDMLLSANEILISSGELAGGIIIDITQENILPQNDIKITDQVIFIEDNIFDVGTMP